MKKLIKLSDEQIKTVCDLAEKFHTNQAEIIRTLIDLAKDINPENFVIIACDANNLKYINSESLSIHNIKAQDEIRESTIHIMYIAGDDGCLDKSKTSVDITTCYKKI